MRRRRSASSATAVISRSGRLAASQLDGLRAATASVGRVLRRDPGAREAAEEIAAMRAEIDPEPGPACAGQAGQDSTASTGDATPGGRPVADGDDARRGGGDHSESDLVPENCGDFLFAFQAGRFAFTTENQDACIWAYGSYSVDGDTVEWRIEDGGGEAPNDAANEPGEVFHYRWSQYRDQLTLEPLEGEISPEPFRVEPWRLLDGEPSVDALSSSCPPPADALEP